MSKKDIKITVEIDNEDVIRHLCYAAASDFAVILETVASHTYNWSDHDGRIEDIAKSGCNFEYFLRISKRIAKILEAQKNAGLDCMEEV